MCFIVQQTQNNFTSFREEIYRHENAVEVEIARIKVVIINISIKCQNVCVRHQFVRGDWNLCSKCFPENSFRYQGCSYFAVQASQNAKCKLLNCNATGMPKTKNSVTMSFPRPRQVGYKLTTLPDTAIQFILLHRPEHNRNNDWPKNGEREPIRRDIFKGPPSRELPLLYNLQLWVMCFIIQRRSR